MIPTGYVYDSAFLLHTLNGHPENASRLSAITDYLHTMNLLSFLIPVDFEGASHADLSYIHAPVYIERIRRLSEVGGGMLGQDTYVTSGTYHAACMAAGSVIGAVQAVLAGEMRRCFALVRPPGHHASSDHGEGFCLFNNIALGAAHALGRLKSKPPIALERVMIIDWDVHHGNGTESIYYRDPAVLYASIHQSPLYPGTGSVSDMGTGNGHGYNINVPLPPGTGDLGYRDVVQEIISPAAMKFRPQLILVSVGYDVHWRDPLAGMLLSLDGITAVMAGLAKLSERLCDNRMVVVLEGGYDQEVLKYGVYNTFMVLLNNIQAVRDPIGPDARREVNIGSAIRQVRQLHGL